MSWGTELWDQFDNLASHAQKGIYFCERFANFTRDRIDIENDYANKLKKLVKNFQPKKKEKDEDSELTVSKGFQLMLKELHDMAGQHEVIAENLNNNVVKVLQTNITELKQERKKFQQEESKYQKSLQQSLQQLEQSKKQYERAFRDAEKAVEAHRKADADQNLSRAEVERAKNNMLNKIGQCDSCKKEYAAELQKTNASQQTHYQTNMPELLKQMEDADRRRITKTSELITYCSKVEREVIPIINTCIDGISNAAQQVSPDEDVRLIIERYKSGFTPPGEFEFEDLGDPGNTNGTSASTHSTPKSVQRAETMKMHGTQSGGKVKQRKGIFGIFSSSKIIGLLQSDEAKEDFSHLPPQQQKKELQKQIDSIHSQIKSKTSERDGLQKLQDVYVQNSAMGDPATLDGQLEENARELDRLQQTLQKFQNYLADAGQNQYEAHNNIQRKMSNLSATSSSNTGSNPGTPLQIRAQTEQVGRVSPEGGDGAHLHSYHDDDSFEGEVDDFSVIGSAVALYHFDAPNEGSIPMKEGEQFQVIEADLGDGWTRVRKQGGDEGFVPTSYIQVKLD